MRNENNNQLTPDKQSAIVYFENGLPYPEALYETGHALCEQIEKEKVGCYDWHCTAADDSHGWLYMYGPDAEKLFETVRPVLEQAAFLKGASVTLHCGREKKSKEFTL